MSSFACLCGAALGDASENLKPRILLRFVEYGVVLGRCWFCLRRLSSKSLVVKSFPGEFFLERLLNIVLPLPAIDLRRFKFFELSELTASLRNPRRSDSSLFFPSSFSLILNSLKLNSPRNSCWRNSKTSLAFFFSTSLIFFLSSNKTVLWTNSVFLPRSSGSLWVIPRNLS